MNVIYIKINMHLNKLTTKYIIILPKLSIGFFCWYHQINMILERSTHCNQV